MAVGVSRRGLIGGTAAFATGVTVTAAARAVSDLLDARQRLPSDSYGAATHADRRTAPRNSTSVVRWSVDTTQRLAALTFDDGPRPQWTPDVLDMLDAHQAPATFFLVGERVREHAGILSGRLARHEVGNHSWDHQDLARFSYEQAYADLSRAHAEITTATGREPRLMRPPYGHVGGGTLLAAAELGYDVTLWSVQMLESEYLHNPPGLADYIVGATKPGSIILAHDTGPEDRLVALRNLPQMISGLRSRGFQLVTVSELLRSATPAPQPHSGPDTPALAAPGEATTPRR